MGIQAGFVWAAAHKEGVGTVSCCLHRCVGGGGGVLLQHTTASARRLSHQHMCSREVTCKTFQGSQTHSVTLTSFKFVCC